MYIMIFPDLPPEQVRRFQEMASLVLAFNKDDCLEPIQVVKDRISTEVLRTMPLSVMPEVVLQHLKRLRRNKNEDGGSGSVRQEG